MVKYVIINMVFSDETMVKFEAASDKEAIALFQKRYQMGTDDGGWSLSREDDLLNPLYTTEGDPRAKKEPANYLNYA